MFFRCLLVFSLASAAFAQAPSAQVPSAQVPSTQVPAAPAPPAVPTQPGQPALAPQIDPAARLRVIADLHDKRFDAALAESKAILAANPNSPPANKLVGIVLLDQQKPADALPYFQRALQLDPSDANVHALLLQGYAESGDTKGRDEQRAILHGFHTDGKHPDFTNAHGYLVESFPVGDKTVQAIEFYEPYGSFHLYYRFNIFSSDGHLERFLTLESDDADQAAFAREHPKQVAAGERRFSLDSYQESSAGLATRGLIALIDGLPKYDDLRARVIKIVQGEIAPAGTTVITPGISNPPR